MYTCSAKTRGDPGPDAVSNKTSFSPSPKGADFSRGKTFRVTQSVFPQIPHVAGTFLAVFPCPTTCRTRPGTTRRSHLMIGQQATGSMRYTFAVRTGEFPFFWIIEIGTQRSSGSIWVIIVDFRLSLRRTNHGVFTTPLADSSLRFLPSTSRKYDCAESYRLLSPT